MFPLLKFSSKGVCLLLMFCLISLGGCSDSDVELVRDSALNYDKTVTIGDAFDSYPYFKKTHWSAFADRSKRRIVQFEGVFDLLEMLPRTFGNGSRAAELCKQNKNSILYTNDYIFVAQFALTQDGGFTLAGMEIKTPDPQWPVIPIGMGNLGIIYSGDIFTSFMRLDYMCEDWLEKNNK